MLCALESKCIIFKNTITGSSLFSSENEKLPKSPVALPGQHVDVENRLYTADVIWDQTTQPAPEHNNPIVCATRGPEILK